MTRENTGRMDISTSHDLSGRVVVRSSHKTSGFDAIHVSSKVEARFNNEKGVF